VEEIQDSSKRLTMAAGAPLVSVVIPTYLRPRLVTRAVRSALNQTLREIEVIVVADGRDEETRSTLGRIPDGRIRVYTPPRRLGNASARNEGIARARARWVAFLDDDDEWLSTKLEAQLRAARASAHEHPIVACRLIARDEGGDFVWPRRLPAPGEPLSEYFFCRRTPFTGEGLVITSAILTSRELLRRVRFRSGLERHVDPDWLLRAAGEPGTSLEFVPESAPLLIWHIERGRDRITTRPDWRTSLTWSRTNRTLFTARGYAAFILHVVSANAAAEGERGSFFRLVQEAFDKGRPSPVDLASHLANFVLPARLQRGIARRFARISARRASRPSPTESGSMSPGLCPHPRRDS
jgi:glycosyltransferase involved in cell wall biosynthesis